MKTLFAVVLGLVFIQNAHAIRNSQCMIEVSNENSADILLKKGYFPITTEAADRNGYHPGLKVTVLQAGYNYRGSITDGSGVILAHLGYYNEMETLFNQFPNCADLAR